MAKKVNCPCVGCKYYDVCGDESRTEPCKGREEEEKK